MLGATNLLSDPETTPDAVARRIREAVLENNPSFVCDEMVAWEEFGDNVELHANWTEWLRVACESIRPSMLASGRRQRVMRMGTNSRGEVICRMTFFSKNDWFAVAEITWLAKQLEEIGITLPPGLVLKADYEQHVYYCQGEWVPELLDELQVGFNAQLFVGCGKEHLLTDNVPVLMAAISLLLPHKLVSICGGVIVAVRFLDALLSCRLAIPFRFARTPPMDKAEIVLSDLWNELRAIDSTVFVDDGNSIISAEQEVLRVVTRLRESWVPLYSNDFEKVPRGSFRPNGKHAGLLLQAASRPFSEKMFDNITRKRNYSPDYLSLERSIGDRVTKLTRSFSNLPLSKTSTPRSQNHCDEYCISREMRERRAVIVIQLTWRQYQRRNGRCTSPTVLHPCTIQRLRSIDDLVEYSMNSTFQKKETTSRPSVKMQFSKSAQGTRRSKSANAANFLNDIFSSVVNVTNKV
jgi:hypothetical protein